MTYNIPSNQITKVPSAGSNFRDLKGTLKKRKTNTLTSGENRENVENVNRNKEGDKETGSQQLSANNTSVYKSKISPKKSGRANTFASKTIGAKGLSVLYSKKGSSNGESPPPNNRILSGRSGKNNAKNLLMSKPKSKSPGMREIIYQTPKNNSITKTSTHLTHQSINRNQASSQKPKPSTKASVTSGNINRKRIGSSIETTKKSSQN